MKAQSTTTGEQLANALHALGVKFIMGGKSRGETLHQTPVRLITALAESDEARLRLALIPLFLEHPEYSAHVREAAKNLDPSPRVTLQCYYSAAVFLQQIYHVKCNALIGEKQSLPDYFSHELELFCSDDPEKKLSLLAKRHQVLSGAHINWLGTYKHAMQRWLIPLEKHKE